MTLEIEHLTGQFFSRVVYDDDKKEIYFYYDEHGVRFVIYHHFYDDDPIAIDNGPLIVGSLSDLEGGEILNIMELIDAQEEEDEYYQHYKITSENGVVLIVWGYMKTIAVRLDVLKDIK